MAKQSVSFLMESEKVAKLDSLASDQDRDRSYVLNEAVDLYLDLQRHHRALIQKGLDAIGAGDVLTNEEIEQQIAARRQQRAKADAE